MIAACMIVCASVFWWSRQVESGKNTGLPTYAGELTSYVVLPRETRPPKQYMYAVPFSVKVPRGLDTSDPDGVLWTSGGGRIRIHFDRDPKGRTQQLVDIDSKTETSFEVHGWLGQVRVVDPFRLQLLRPANEVRSVVASKAPGLYFDGTLEWPKAKPEEKEELLKVLNCALTSFKEGQ